MVLVKSFMPNNKMTFFLKSSNAVIGDTIPSGIEVDVISGESTPSDLSVLFKNKKVVLFAVPGGKY